MSTEAPPIPADQEAIYGEWIRNQRWRDRLSRRTAHKALNVPDDDMNVNVKSGLTWRELLALGVVLCGAALAWHGLDRPPAAGTDTDTDTQYQFDVKAGKR